MCAHTVIIYIWGITDESSNEYADSLQKFVYWGDTEMMVS